MDKNIKEMLHQVDYPVKNILKNIFFNLAKLDKKIADAEKKRVKKSK